MKQKIQLEAVPIAFAGARIRSGVTSALYRNGIPTQARPKKVLNRKMHAIATAWAALLGLRRRKGSMKKQAP
jgi:hypothetical protein